LVPTDGGSNFSKECRTANVGNEGVSYRPVAPRVLQTSDALLGGDVEARGESQVSDHMTTRHLYLSEEAIAELSRCGVIVWYKWKAGFDATWNGVRWVTRKGKRGR